MFLILFFFFNDTATTEIYTLSLHDALPISHADEQPRSRGRRAAAGTRGLRRHRQGGPQLAVLRRDRGGAQGARGDRKSTRLNSSHSQISYAVFCLKKKK